MRPMKLFLINRKIITRTVLILSLVSFFNDVASEMLYPVMPIYLKSIGFSILLIGILEGLAEAIAGISKGFFGQWSDTIQKRTPFVRTGYLLTALTKPMLAVSVLPVWVFIVRTLDRLGKGIRTGARDAILSDEATIETKGQVFGFHRSLDTFGAVLGPLSALIFLYFLPGKYRLLFLLAFIPGLLATALIMLLKERKRPMETRSLKVSFFGFIAYVRESPLLYRKLILGLLFFALVNSSDVFLLLKIKSAGYSDIIVIGVYIFYNLVFALSSYPIGLLADKIGMKAIFIIGLMMFAIVYFGMAFSNTIYFFLFLFILYGLYAASTEGISKAWISNLTEKKDTATAIGAFTAFQSICTLGASSVAGFLWFKFGPAVTFCVSAIATLLVALFLLSIRFKKS
jgi:MFS family permease